MDTILRVSNLKISLANDTNIINDVSFEIRGGEVVAIVGDNGAGKSTILKAIMREDIANKKVSGEISYCGGKNILEMNDKELQDFRAGVAYVPQKDEYNNIGKRMTVFDIMSDSAELYSLRPYKKEFVKKLFDKYQLRIYDDNGKPLFYEKSCPAKLSGGQQRLLSIVSAVAIRENAKLFIIDEPLNNLDFKNARQVSNLITRIHKENPGAAILMVTHCRIFPAITRLITVEKGRVVQNQEEYVCHSCFGKANEEGYYE